MATLRLSHGELTRQAHAFQERYGFRREGHLRQLRQGLVRAGWHARADLVQAW